MTTVCYLDEFGNNGFDFSKEGVSTHFVVCGFITTESSMGELESIGDSVSHKHFGGSEVKSSNIVLNDDRRMVVLQEQLEWESYWIDKFKELNSGRLPYYNKMVGIRP